MHDCYFCISFKSDNFTDVSLWLSALVLKPLKPYVAYPTKSQHKTTFFCFQDDLKAHTSFSCLLLAYYVVSVEKKKKFNSLDSSALGKRA